MPKIVQFTHPGGEHKPDKNNKTHKSWNKGKHQRKFLNAFDPSKVIWIFRYYQDVVNSSMKRNWGKHCSEYVKNINAGKINVRIDIKE